MARIVEAQSAMAALPDCEMVVTTDLAGSAKDIHPTEKKPVGQRLANLALLESYGHCQLIARSPRFFEATFGENGTVDLHFTYVGQGLLSTDEQPLSHFQIAGEEGNFVPALATILDRDTVRVSAKNVPDPKAVRFAWDETAQPNLANSARLPAIPFRTDDWPIQTIRPKSKDKSAD
jgi:sialate O-acetylesterase